MRLSAALYSREAVERAVAAFAALADCRLVQAGEYLEVRVRAHRGRSSSLVARQLANHALAETVVGLEPVSDVAAPSADGSSP
ncbi:MAG: hypothetical protein HY906_08985 [Deltaproteobacteria bacterium]|nr:hypothetical protein [Deltaproteobacteria bacterium]